MQNTNIISSARKTQKKIKEVRTRRGKRVKMSIQGSFERPRLSVFRSSLYMYAQIIDDAKGHTLVSARGILKESGKIGESLAKQALVKKIESVVFDRGSFAYHGHIKELAEGARKGGLKF